MGHGPGQPMKNPEAGPARPVIFFRAQAAALPGPSNFKNRSCSARPIKFSIMSPRPGPAHNISTEAHETRAPYGPPVDLKSRPMGRLTGWPMCYPDLNKCAHRRLTLFFTGLHRLIVSSGIRYKFMPIRSHIFETNILNTSAVTENVVSIRICASCVIPLIYFRIYHQHISCSCFRPMRHTHPLPTQC